MSGALAIPAASIVSVTPSVISAGGNALNLSGLLLTTNTRVPTGSVITLPSKAAVDTFFGAASQESLLAGVYFLGFDNSNQKPGAMLFAQYNQSAVGGWLRGGSLFGMTLAQLQALTGTITIVIDGVTQTSSSINLSSATSWSNAAELISVALNTTGPAGASFTGAISGTTLTISAVSSGTVSVGQEIRGPGVSPGTVLSAFLTGTGNTGTYTVSLSQTVTSETMTTNTATVTYDSVTGGFYVVSPTTGANSSVGFATGTLASSVGLTQSTGATTSRGAVPASPATFMARVIAVTQNWASFTTSFDPDNGSGNTVKRQFATWVNSTVDRYTYVAWDTDASPTTSVNATTSLGNILQVANSNGTIPVYSPANGTVIAAFIMGYIASVDFTETNGRTTGAFRGQTGISPDVTDQAIAENLAANGYNFYGTYGTANDTFTWLYPGQITGPFEWIDSYINQIWLNNQFQLALMTLLQNTKSIPYNQVGYGMIRAALMDPINQGLDFGAFRAGVTLSQAQIAEVNNAAGKKIDDTLSTQGWFLQVKDALPQVRAARGTPPILFHYTDGQSVQKLSMSSVEVQ
jgi:hypothetical protein